MLTPPNNVLPQVNFPTNNLNITICKKGKVKDEASRKIRKTNGGQIKEQDVPLT
jgi:hypothetical protein